MEWLDDWYALLCFASLWWYLLALALVSPWLLIWNVCRYKHSRLHVCTERDRDRHRHRHWHIAPEHASAQTHSYTLCATITNNIFTVKRVYRGCNRCMHLFVLSGLSTNIPIGFSFVFTLLSFVAVKSVEPNRWVVYSCSWLWLLLLLLLTAFRLNFLVSFILCGHCARQILADWNVSHRFPALCLPTFMLLACCNTIVVPLDVHCTYV